MKKNCFVIMGFGIKKIPNTNISVNLDDTYKYLIKPVLIQQDLISVQPDSNNLNAYRCDEFFTTQAIDRLFLTNLYIADIVVADITALNQNAIYELGLRHAMKPKSTIIICDNQTLKNNTFFDLTFNPRIIYDSEKQKDIQEIKRVSKQLSNVIEICKNSDDEYMDSPVFIYGVYKNAINSINTYPNMAGSSLKNELINGNNLIEEEKYYEAELVFKNILDNYKYYDNTIICQYILAAYKKEISVKNLSDSFLMLKKYINIESTTHEDSLGLAASINLKLFNLTQEAKYLFTAIEYYHKGSNYESGNIYCGKNYCSTMLKIYLVEKNIEVIKEYYYTAVHSAKLFLTYANLINRKSDTYNNVWFLSNQNDLLLISSMVNEFPFRILYNTNRQQTTIENGRLDLVNDLSNIRNILGIN